MDLYIIRDGAFTTNNGKPASNLLHYKVFGERYLDVFEKVHIVGRLFDKDDKTALPVEGEGVNFIPLPGKRGMKGAIAMLLTVIKFAFSNSKRGDAYLLRIPGTIPSIMCFVLLLKRIPFAVEVAADPFDSYSSKALDSHPFSSLIQFLFVKLVKFQCKRAMASVYVTDYSLQKKYPPGIPENSFGFTSIDLKPEAFTQTPKKFDKVNQRNPKIVLTGNMQGSMKGHDVLIKALASVREQGVDATLTIIGFGNNMEHLKQMCIDYNVEESVRFTGKLSSGEPIREILREADLFVLPSRQEGLPRALLEAMAMGLPAIATNVGGVPELIDSEAIVEPESVDALSAKILGFLNRPEKMTLHASKNFIKAQNYKSENIRVKRNAFLSCLKSVS